MVRCSIHRMIRRMKFFSRQPVSKLIEFPKRMEFYIPLSSLGKDTTFIERKREESDLPNLAARFVSEPGVFIEFFYIIRVFLRCSGFIGWYASTQLCSPVLTRSWHPDNRGMEQGIGQGRVCNMFPRWIASE